MVIKVGINGFGRIGRIVFRACCDNEELKLSAINDPALDAEYICYLIKYDSTHGKFRGSVTQSGDEITVDGQIIKVFNEKLPSNIPWQCAGVQYVVESSGMFTTLEKTLGHLRSNEVRRVIVTAPSVDIPMLVLGVNDSKITTDQKILSCTSSTLYCLAPIIKVLEEHFGVSEGFVTSIHAMTPSLKPLDGLCLKGKHWRDHRSIHQNIIPAATGACKALGKILPQVKDKMSGLAFRVPIVNVSVLDITVRLNKDTTLQEIFKNIQNAKNCYLRNIIKINCEENVSSDFIGETHSCIVDATSSLQLKTNFYKFICWYENEYSYACRVLDTVFFSEKQFAFNALSPRPKCYKKFTISSIDKPDIEKPKLMLGSSENYALNIKYSETKNMLPLEHVKNKSDSLKAENVNNILKLTIPQPKHNLIQSCLELTSENQRRVNLKAQQRLEIVKREFCKMINITEDLLKKSYSNKANVSQVQSTNDKNYEVEQFNKNQQLHCLTIQNYEKSNHGAVIKEKDSGVESALLADFEFNHKKQTTIQFVDIESDKLVSEKEIKTYNYCKDDKIVNLSDRQLVDCLLKENKDTKIELKADIKDFVTSHLKEVDDKAKSNNNSNIVQVKANTDGDEKEQTYKKIKITRNDAGPVTETEVMVLSVPEKDVSPSSYMLCNNLLQNTIDVPNTLVSDISKNQVCLLQSEKEKLILKIEDSLAPKTSEKCNVKIEKYVDTLNELKSEPVMVVANENCSDVTVSTNGEVKVKNLFDKLESVSGSETDCSFEIHNRKSQIVHITDLTNSTEDLARLDKICKIIEISDELSDKLFSVLGTEDAKTLKNKKWSFKDLCERIKLDDFCDDVFGKPTSM